MWIERYRGDVRSVGLVSCFINDLQDRTSSVLASSADGTELGGVADTKIILWRN